MPRMIGLGLYRFDINFRESAVVGIVGVRLQHRRHHRTGYVPGVVSRTWPRGRLFRSRRSDRLADPAWPATRTACPLEDLDRLEGPAGARAKDRTPPARRWRRGGCRTRPRPRR